jgi:hypothetical protein
MECYYRILEQVCERFDRGIYNLDRYRRIIPGRHNKTRVGYESLLNSEL